MEIHSRTSKSHRRPLSLPSNHKDSSKGRAPCRSGLLEWPAFPCSLSPKPRSDWVRSHECWPARWSSSRTSDYRPENLYLYTLSSPKSGCPRIEDTYQQFRRPRQEYDAGWATSPTPSHRPYAHGSGWFPSSTSDSTRRVCCRYCPKPRSTHPSTISIRILPVVVPSC